MRETVGEAGPAAPAEAPPQPATGRPESLLALASVVAHVHTGRDTAGDCF